MSYSNQKVGQANILFTEKVTGNSFQLQLDVCFDVSAQELTDIVSMNFAAGQGFDRQFRNNLGVALGTFTQDQSARRAYYFKFAAGSALDMGLSLFENGVKSGDTLELWHR